MATYVLVPGAWLGGWAWREVAASLREEGHDVYPITLTGLGERSHLARPDIDLETHITDVVNVIKWNDLEDVILAGHSYAGIVVTGVADRMAERLSQLVFVDAAPFANGLAFADLYTPEGRAGMQDAVDRCGDGWRLPFPGFAALAGDASSAGLDDEVQLLIEAKSEAQPWRSYTQPLRLDHGGPLPYQLVAIACEDMRSMIAAGVPEIVPMTREPWRYFDLQTGHWPMFSAPEELAAVLDGLAGE